VIQVGLKQMFSQRAETWQRLPPAKNNGRGGWLLSANLSLEQRCATSITKKLDEARAGAEAA
jgi:hypothetical protein